jgi:glutamate dehydrogenase
MQNRLYEEISHIFARSDAVAAEDRQMAKARYRPKPLAAAGSVQEAEAAFAGQIPTQTVRHGKAEYQNARRAGKLAGEIAPLLGFALVPEIMQIAERTGEPLVRAAESYFAVSQTFRVGRLLAAGGRIVTSDHYENLALGAQHRPDRRRGATSSSRHSPTTARKSCRSQAWHATATASGSTASPKS